MEPEEDFETEEPRMLKPSLLKFPFLDVTLVFQCEDQEDYRIGKASINNFFVKNDLETNRLDTQTILEGLKCAKKISKKLI